MISSVTIAGTFCSDLEMKTLTSGKVLLSARVVVNHKYRKPDGEIKESPMYILIKAFGRIGEIINQFFTKGDKICLSGRLQEDHWTLEDGSHQSRHYILVNDFDFCGSTKKKSQSNGNNGFNE